MFGANLISGLFGGGIGAINDVIGTIFGSAKDREDYRHVEQASAMQSEAAEFQYRGQRYFLDAVADFINRLPRPLFAFGVFALLFLAPYNPIQFTIIMKAYEAVPEWLSLVAAQVIMLFFGGRMLDKMPTRLKGVSNEEFKGFMGQMGELHQMQRQQMAQDANEPDTQSFEEDMADTSTTMSNASILEWNRRRGAGSSK